MTTFTVPASYVERQIAYPATASSAGRLSAFPGVTSWGFYLTAVATAESWTLVADDIINIYIPTPGLGVVSAVKNTNTSNADVLAIKPSMVGNAASGTCPHARASGSATVNTALSTVAVSGIVVTPVTCVSLTLLTSVPAALYIYVGYESGSK